MGVQKINKSNDVNCRRGRVFNGGAVQTWTPNVYECGTVLNSGIASTRFDETDYYCCTSGTGGGDTIINEGDTYNVTNIVQISGSGTGGGLTYLSLGEVGTLSADISGEIDTEPRVPTPTTYTFTIVDAIATLGASGSTETHVGVYITDNDGVTASPIHFTIPANSVRYQVPGLVGQTVTPSGYLQKNIVSAGTGAADLNIGIYGNLTQ